ncbi:MAG TPA: hypothetical protein PKK86_06965, partial [Candidatus Syntrophosphaera sp.]|nr:hypothetical protein [Candidatus Syntrophosphaera sp.]
QEIYICVSTPPGKGGHFKIEAQMFAKSRQAFVSTPPGKGGHFKSLDFSPLAERVWDPISVNLL